MDWNQSSSVQSLSRVGLFAILWTTVHQASCPSLSPWVCSDSCPLSQWCQPTISSSVILFSSIESWCHPTISSSSPPTFNLSLHQGLLQWVSSLYQVAKVLELQLWTGMGKFNSCDHYIYYCMQESLRRNGVALIVNKESEMQYLGAISKTTEWPLFISNDI